MELQQQFFDFELPCPEEIPHCSNLRIQFAEELSTLKSSGGCTSCLERNLRNKYIMFILSTSYSTSKNG